MMGTATEASPRRSLILGASSGFGAATARAFAARGWAVHGVHLDRRSGMPRVEALRAALEADTPEAVLYNCNAADDAQRAAVLDAVAERGPVDVLVHSLAFGSLAPMVPVDDGAAPATRKQLDMTLHVMANTLVYWARDLVERGLLGAGGRVFALTSSGSHSALYRYGPVGAAKAALEAHCRQLSLELAGRGVAVNAVMAGVCDTPALRKIPGHEELMDKALAKNPHGRLTVPEDVAEALVALSAPGLHWMTGNVLRVDGGEDVCA